MFQNKHGWGLNEMLFLSAILLFFVFFVAIMINSLYKGLEKKDTTQLPTTNDIEYSYEDIENNLKSAAKKYLKIEKEEYSIVTSDTLIEKGYINIKKMTSKNDICEGYVVLNKEFDTFILCANYQTEGYEYE